MLGTGQQRGPDRSLQKEVVSLAVRRRLDAERVELGLGGPEMIRDLRQVIAIAVVKQQPRAQPEYDDVGGALSPRGRDGNHEQRRGGLGPHATGEPQRGVAEDHLRAGLSIVEGGGAHSRPHGRVHRRRIGEPRRPYQPERARPAVIAVDERERNVVTRAL